MPAKYHINCIPAPPKHKPIGKYGIVDMREDCSACHNCVKRECTYDVYDRERDRLQGTVDYVDYLYECKGCLCCVQTCTKGLLTSEVNPEYQALGNEVWTPDIISSTWFQAETGKIPVSGAGYPGPFSGPGFDAILTDMSEIVRPTRDGIHGREYISTQVDIGRKPLRLEFDGDGSLISDIPPLMEIPIPVIFNTMPWHKLNTGMKSWMVEAAQELGTGVIVDEPSFIGTDACIPAFEDANTGDAEQVKAAQWSDSPQVVEHISAAKNANPELIAIVKVPIAAGCVERAVSLVDDGADAIHLCADWRGYAEFDRKPIHISEAIRKVHQEFVARGIRDEITLIASGGISLAEHVVKSLLCGADLAAVDIPLMIALECRVCEKCLQGLECPIGIAGLDRGYAVQRIVNLMGAWHSQMLEMMGAMGIRDARRLRGEVGRAMFFEDLERECFAPIFGERKGVR